MNSRLALRRVSGYTMATRMAADRWTRAAGDATGLAWLPLPVTPTLLRIEAWHDGQSWSGLLDLADWTAATLPGLVALAPSARRRERMLELFRATDRPLLMPGHMPELRYDSVTAHLHDAGRGTGVHGGSDRIYLAIDTPQARIWIDRLPPRGDDAGALDMPLSPRACHLPVPLALSLGHTDIRPGLLRSMRRGDLMLLASHGACVRSAGQAIAALHINQDGTMMLQDMNDHPPSHDDSVPDPFGLASDGDPDSGSGEVLHMAGAAEIPVRIDFVLQRRVMTLGQLDRLFRGEVLALDPQAEQRVELVAGGVCVARGELVELDGRLGVEIHHIAARSSVK